MWFIALVDPGQLTVNLTDKLFHSIDNHLGMYYWSVAMETMCCYSTEQWSVNCYRYGNISNTLPINDSQW